MLRLSISNEKKDLTMYKKKQWNRSQNGEVTVFQMRKGPYVGSSHAVALTPALSHREREKTGTNLNLHAIGPLSLRERVRVRVVFKHQTQKSPLKERAFQIWSVIEDNSPLRGSPCGPLLAQRSLASLESNLPAPGGSHPRGYRRKKARS